MSKGVTGRVRPCEVRGCEQMHEWVSLWVGVGEEACDRGRECDWLGMCEDEEGSVRGRTSV